MRDAAVEPEPNIDPLRPGPEFDDVALRLEERLQLAKAVECGLPLERLAAQGAVIERLASDSRRCGPGIAFFAYPGAAADGRAHIPDAIRRGAAGGRDNGAPGLRPHYHPHYYGAFVLDPDGHNIEAVCHEPG